MTKKATKDKHATPTETEAGASLKKHTGAANGRAKKNGKAAKAKKRALLAGISDYPEERNDLGSCVADVMAMKHILERAFGFDEVTSLIDAEVTPGNLTRALDRLFTGVTPLDRLVLYYSGHGYQMKDSNDVKQEYLVLSDGSLFQDNELVKRAAKLPPGVLTVIFDSCFSGGMEKLLQETARLASLTDKSIVHSGPAEILQKTAKAISSTLTPQIGRIKTYIPPNLDKFIEDQQTEPTGGFKAFGSATRKIDGFGEAGISKDVILNAPSDETREPVLNGLLISACKENETASADTPLTSGLSAFTYGLSQVISRRGSRISAEILCGEITSILKAMGFRQSPQIKEPKTPDRMSQLSFIELTPIESVAQPPIPLNGDYLTSQIIQYLMSLLSAQPYKRQSLFESMEDIQRMDTQPGVDLQTLQQLQQLLASISQGSQPAFGQGKGIFEELGRSLIPILTDTLRDVLSKSLAGQPTWGMPAGQEKPFGFPFISPTLPTFPPPFLDAIREALSKSLAGQPTWGMPGGQEKFLGAFMPLLSAVVPVIVETVRDAVSKSILPQPIWGQERPFGFPFTSPTAPPTFPPSISDALREAVSKSLAGQPTLGVPAGQEKFILPLLGMLGPALIPPIFDAVRDALSKSLAGQPTWGTPAGQGKDFFGDMSRALGSVLIPSLLDAVKDALSKSPGVGNQRGH